MLINLKFNLRRKKQILIIKIKISNCRKGKKIKNKTKSINDVKEKIMT